jgi:hypothetical protein
LDDFFHFVFCLRHQCVPIVIKRVNDSYKNLKDTVNFDILKKECGFVGAIMGFVIFQGLFPHSFKHRIYMYIVGLTISKLTVSQPTLTKRSSSNFLTSPANLFTSTEEPTSSSWLYTSSLSSSRCAAPTSNSSES